MRYHVVKLVGIPALPLAIGPTWLPPVSGEKLSSDRAVSTNPSNVCYIPALYHHLLSRAPSSSEISYGLTFLGGHTRSQYAALLLAGAEYRTDLIQSKYVKFLGRSATAVDVSFWLSFLGAGGTDELFSADILASDEYFLLSRVGGTNTGFITAIYMDVLGRPVDTSSLTFWLVALGSGTSRLQVAQSLLSGAEYRTGLIQGWYQTFLDRAATASELTACLSLFGSGTTDEQIIADMTGSDEYFEHAGFCKIDLPLVVR